MKRNVTETLERGFRNTIANWPLLLLKIAATIAMAAVVIVSVVATVVPVAISLGFRDWTAKTPDDAVELLVSLLSDHWPVLLLVVAVITLALTIAVAIMSFVEAGTTFVLVEGDRRAAAGAKERSAFEAFSMERWLDGAKREWWSIFWIYNVAWTVGGGVLLVPLVLTLGGMLLAGQGAGAIAIGCVGLGISLLMTIAIVIAVNLWVRKSIVIAVSRSLGAVESMRSGAREMLADFGRHFAVAFVLTAISVGVSGASSVLSMVGSLDRSGMAGFAMIPMQIGASVLTGVISAVIAMWLTASFAALTMEA